MRISDWSSDVCSSDLATPPPSGETRAPAAPRPPAAGIADKLRGHADSMQAKRDDCFRDRDPNTPPTAPMAAGARIDGKQWERAPRIARAPAATHHPRTAPAALARRSPPPGAL